MQIVPIFEDCLYVVHYNGEEKNAYLKVLEQWNDPEFLIDLCRKNRSNIPREYDCYQYADFIQDDAADLEMEIENIAVSNRSFDEIFEHLQPNEYQTRPLSKRKAKYHRLRLYAIRISASIYIITGGAIKLTQTMQEHEITNEELSRINRVRDFLRENGILDDDSFNNREIQP